MKKNMTLIPLIIGLVLGLVVQGRCAPIDLIVASSPYLSQNDKNEFRKELLELVLEELEPGTSVTLLDGWTGSIVATLKIPHLPLDSVTGRTRKMRRELAAVVQWLNNSDPSTLAETGAIDLPEISEKIRRTASRMLLLVGSPVYYSPGAPEQTWRQGDEWFYPSDGTLFGQAGVSPWVVSSGGNRLQGKAVHWLRMGEREAAGVYSEKVERFLTLFIQSEGGSLVTYLDDVQRVFGDLDRSDLSADRYEFDGSIDKLEMISLNDISIDRRREDIESSKVIKPVVPPEPVVPLISQSLPPVVPVVPATPATPTVPKAPQPVDLLATFEQAAQRHKAVLSVGIMWDQPGLDLDLYVFTGGSAVPVYFDNPSNGTGSFLQDYLSATGSGLEQVVMNRGATPQFEAWVNVHTVSGVLSGPITGQVILRESGRSRVSQFTISAQTGNQGGDRVGRASSPYWRQVAFYSPDGGKRVAD